MKINLAEKFKENIEKKFGDKSFDEMDTLSAKENAMWRLVFWLLKDNYPQEVFDTEAQKEYLEDYLDLFFSAIKEKPFTLKEWEDFLVSK